MGACNVISNAQTSKSHPLEQRQAHRAEATPEAPWNLGDPNTTTNIRKTRDLALFNLALDSKLRSCDLVNLKVRDIAHGKQISKRAIIMQQKQSNPSNLKSRSKLVRCFQTGLNKKNCLMMIFFFSVASANRTLFLQGNMHEYQGIAHL